MRKEPVGIWARLRAWLAGLVGCRAPQVVQRAPRPGGSRLAAPPAPRLAVPPVSRPPVPFAPAAPARPHSVRPAPAGGQPPPAPEPVGPEPEPVVPAHLQVLRELSEVQARLGTVTQELRQLQESVSKGYRTIVIQRVEHFEVEQMNHTIGHLAVDQLDGTLNVGFSRNLRMAPKATAAPSPPRVRVAPRGPDGGGDQPPPSAGATGSAAV